MGLKKYIEAPVKYTDIQQFIREFTGEINDEYEVNWGMDFTFRGKEYHLCRYQMESSEKRVQFSEMLARNLSKCKYEVALCRPRIYSFFSTSNMDIIGWYEDIYDMLENCIIDGMKLKDVLLSDEFIKTGKD